MLTKNQTISKLEEVVGSGRIQTYSPQQLEVLADFGSRFEYTDESMEIFDNIIEEHWESLE